MRIFVLGTRGFPNIQGGIEKHCEALYPLLVKFGCDVTVFTRKPYFPKFRRLNEWNGVKFIHLWTIRKKSFEALIHTFLGIIIARLKSADILHIHGIGPSILIPFAKVLGLKVVMTNHGPDYNRQKWGKIAKLVLKTGEFLGMKFADKVIVISKEIKNMLENKYGRIDLEFISNGVKILKPLPPGDTLKKYNLEPKRYIFTVSRFVPEKGLHDLITAYAEINKPKFKLVISGDADHETDYSKSLKIKAKTIDGVVLTGLVFGKALQELYSNAGLFVLPSYYEGLPIALLEALSYGLPILVSDIPQHREIPLPEFRYFKVGNICELAQKIVELYDLGISDEEKQRYFNLINEKYNWEKIAEKTFEVYKSIEI
jgi:glycosyltransferase involved in cell wall biosynthesis